MYISRCIVSPPSLRKNKRLTHLVVCTWRFWIFRPRPWRRKMRSILVKISVWNFNLPRARQSFLFFFPWRGLGRNKFPFCPDENSWECLGGKSLVWNKSKRAIYDWGFSTTLLQNKVLLIYLVRNFNALPNERHSLYLLRDTVMHSIWIIFENMHDQSPGRVFNLVCVHNNHLIILVKEARSSCR